MKACIVWGDPFSDQEDKLYPSIMVCDECLVLEGNSGEASRIVMTCEFIPDFGGICEFCGKSRDEEAIELMEFLRESVS